MSQSLIELDNLTYRHPEQEEGTPPTLNGISLRIEEGEFVALIGANGSGKTTLARHINALLLPTRGTVHIAGMDTHHKSSAAAIHTTIGMVFQHPEDQIVATTVEEDIAFGPENLALPTQEIRSRVEDALHAVQMSEQRKRPPHLLSAGQMQRVALAGVLAMRPRCIIFDETTAMLDPAGRRNAMEMIQHLHREGLTVILITHFMEEAVLAQRVIVLHQGQVAMDAPPERIFSSAATLDSLGLAPPPAVSIANLLRKSMPEIPQNVLTLENLLNLLPPFPNPDASSLLDPESLRNTKEHPAIISAHNLAYTYLVDTPLAQQALKNVSLEIQHGQIHGLLGATGSGKSTLLQHLNGLLRPQQGKLRVGMHDLNDPHCALRDVRRMAGLVFQIPDNQLFEQYVGDEIAYGPRQMGLIQGLRERVRQAMEIVGLDFETYKDRLTFALSGGERRKVALASTLAMQPKILLLDEPTAGVDPRSRREILAQFCTLAAEGTTLVLSSHRMDDLAALSQNLTVIHQGQDILQGTAMQVFSQRDALQKVGLDQPPVVRVAEELRSRGWPLPPELLTHTKLETALAHLRGGLDGRV
jgi:energy-coupling factor transport system ATP-binding protein